MDLSILILMVLAIAVLLAAAVLVYLQIYKRNINKALNAKAGIHRHMVPPHNMAALSVVLVAAVVVLGIIVAPNFNRITNAHEIEQAAREFQAIGNEWNVEMGMADNFAAVLFYNEDRSDHSFAIYRNTNEVRANYVFWYGGNSTSIQRSVRVFKYDGALALISMNELHIAKIECHDGETYVLDPNSPFVFVIPGGGFDVYDKNGNLIDLEQDWWYELTEKD